MTFLDFVKIEFDFIYFSVIIFTLLTCENDTNIVMKSSIQIRIYNLTSVM